MKKLKIKKSHVVKNEPRRAEKITMGQNMYHTEMRFKSHMEEIRITRGGESHKEETKTA